MIDSFDWHRFLHGDIQSPVTLGRLPIELVKILGCSDELIYLHPSYAPKFLVKHQLNAEHLQMLPVCIERGAVVQDREGALSFLFQDKTIYDGIFHAALKITGQRHEIWIKTFFRLDESEFRRRLKRGKLIREQK